MQSPVLVSYPRHIQSPDFLRPSLFVQPGPVRQSPNVHLSPLSSTLPVVPNEMNGYVHSALTTKVQPHALTTTPVQHQSPHTMFVQPIEDMAPAVQLFTPPTPTVFPPEDINKTHTTASYSKELTPELVNSSTGHWAFTLNVPIPNEMIYPTLTSLEYTVKYGTGNGHGISTIQTSILLSKIPEHNSDADSNSDVDSNPDADSNSDVDSPLIHDGITTDPPSEGNPAVCLSSVPATKENYHTSQWGYYIDRQHILPHVRIIEDSCLYLRLHVAETASALMLRSLVVDVAATWTEDMQGKAMHDKIEAAEMRTQVAEQKRAEEEQARLQADRKSAEAKYAKELAEKMEKAARKKSEDDQQAKKQADRQAEADRLAKQQADARAQKERDSERSEVCN